VIHTLMILIVHLLVTIKKKKVSYTVYIHIYIIAVLLMKLD